MAFFSDDAGGGGGFMSQGASQEETKKKGRGTQALVPVTIKMALGAGQGEGDDAFVIDGREVTQVRLVGNVMRVDKRETKVIYVVEDGSGAIEVTQWLHQGDDELQTTAERQAKMVPTTYVGVVGSLKAFDGKITVSAYDVRPVDDFNEVVHHFLEAVWVHGKVLKGEDQHPVWQPPVAQAPMDVDQNAAGGTSAIQRKVLDYYNEHGTSDTGLNINHVVQACAALYNFSASDVKDAVEALSSEGHLYSTLDDDHHKSTESDI